MDQDQDLIREDMSSETSSSPELEMDEPEPETSGNKIDQEIINQVEEEDEEEELIPTQHPNEVLPFGEQEDEITVNELTHDEKVEKLEDTIKILQQQMAEGNDHIEYELKMRQKEKTNRSLSPHRKAFKPPRRVAKTPEKREKHRKTPKKKRSSSPELEVDYQIKSPHKYKIKTPEKKEKTITPKKTSEYKYDTKETLLSGKKEKHKIKIRVEREKVSKKTSKPEVKKSKSETADALVKLLVPYFKKGLIASKEVFKITARELTHCLLNKSG